MAETRAERQAKIDARVADLRAQADAKQAEADRRRSQTNNDIAFWTQPALRNAQGQAFASQRERELAKVKKTLEIGMEADELRAQADRLEARGAVMAGDAAAEREAVISSCDVQVGQMVGTVFYGTCKVLKVNAKTVLVEGNGGPIKVGKQYLRAA